MSISDSLAVLRGVRDQIRAAIVGKGGTLPPGSPMGSYATAITNLPSGSGGGDTEIPFRSRLTVPGDTDPWHLNHLTATQLSEYAFYQDRLLTTVSLPAVTRISQYAFYQCSALTSADFPLATRIDSYAFNSCTSLTSADFPLATRIDTGAFRYCTKMTSLTLTKNQVATLSSTNALQGTPIESGTGHIYVPDDLVDQYKTATDWATYANQIMPLSQKP